MPWSHNCRHLERGLSPWDSHELLGARAATGDTCEAWAAVAGTPLFSHMEQPVFQGDDKE